ncbi:AraC family transcriptional regulator [Roseivirga sp.]|uniref:AraC family transcriptional regulator n=1 Tax=Roseivirga sp. TaxID=1964215 RepID=UPI003B8B05A1
MIFQQFRPTQRLQPFIKEYYLLEGNLGERVSDVFFADGCIEIVFNLNIDFYRDKEKENWAKIIGQITKPLHIEAEGKGKSFGIWFTPHGFSRLAQLPLQSINDRAIALDNLFPQTLIENIGEYLESGDIKRLVSEINNYFELQIISRAATRKDKLVSYAVQRLSTNERHIAIDKLAEECGVSLRYLQHVFLEKIGLSPKKLQRIIRFQSAIRVLNQNPLPTLTHTGYDVGYADQSHFIRDFKAFSGFTPSQFQSNTQLLNQYFI